MTKITKDEFEKLPESLKSKFTADGDGYALVEEDVEGLKQSKATILAEKKKLADELADLKRFKEEYERNKAATETEAMKKAGQFEELERKLRAALDEQKTAYETEKARLLTTIKRERLTNELTAKGVLADRAKYALADLENEIDLEPAENGFSLKVKNGIGDAGEFDKLIEGMKAKSPFFFAANGATGSGASGSGNGSGAGTGKTMARSQFEQLPAAEQMAYVTAGGKLTD